MGDSPGADFLTHCRSEDSGDADSGATTGRLFGRGAPGAGQALEGREPDSTIVVAGGGSGRDGSGLGGEDRRHGRQTLRDWVHRFNASGPDGLLDNWTDGPKPRLSAGQLAEFAKIVEAGPDRAKDDVVRWRRVDLKRIIAQMFRVEFHERYVGTLLKKLGFSHVSARPRHPAQDERIVEAFKKTSHVR
jgi:transposase